MNKKLFINFIILSTILFAGFFLFVPLVQAGVVQFGDKNIFVDFDGLPFDLSNWAPGMSDTKTITIKNNENFDTDIYFKAKKTSGDDILANALTITINNQSKHLSDLFKNNISLMSVSAGESNNYNIILSFDQDARNKYQNKTINFDFIITVEQVGGNGNGGGQVVIPGGGGGSGTPPGLSIYNESDINASSTSATITWNTSYDATSRVIYDVISGVFDFSAGEMSYGYADYRDGDDVYGSGKGTYHKITLTGLTSGTTYYYRCVSHASPATISQEHSFATLTKEESLKKEEAEKDKEKEEGIISEGETEGTGMDSGTGTFETEEDIGVIPSSDTESGTVITEGGTTEGEESSLEGDLAKIARETDETSGKFGAFGANLVSFLKSIPWWILIIIAILIFLGLFFTRRKEKK